MNEFSNRQASTLGLSQGYRSSSGRNDPKITNCEQQALNWYLPLRKHCCKEERYLTISDFIIEHHVALIAVW